MLEKNLKLLIARFSHFVNFLPHTEIIKPFQSQKTNNKCVQMYIYIIYVFEYPNLYPFFVYLVSSFIV